MLDKLGLERLLDYTVWANHRVMRACATIPPDDFVRELGASYGSLRGTLAHMMWSEWIWLERWHGRSPLKAEAWSLWTTESCGDLNTLSGRWGDVVDRRTQLISTQHAVH